MTAQLVFLFLTFATIGSAVVRTELVASASPQGAVDELIETDRQLGAAAARTDLIPALAAMFDDELIMPLPTGQFAYGKEAAIAALRGNPDNARSTPDWAPIRGGVSADGRHGFTFGYMTVRRPDGTATPVKYLSYWIKRPAGWRVVAYKRRPAASGEVSRVPLAPSLPAQVVPVVHNEAVLAAHKASLTDTENAFSRDAQKIGLGAAFARYGSPDAMNMGGPGDAGFVIGADAIAHAVSEGKLTDPSPVSWSAERVLVASSGDLGITFGMIKQNTSDAAQPHAGVPFFTIWRRDSPSQPWRYIAE